MAFNRILGIFEPHCSQAPYEPALILVNASSICSSTSASLAISDKEKSCSYWSDPMSAMWLERVEPLPAAGFLFSAASLENKPCNVVLRDVKGKLIYEGGVNSMNGVYQKEFNLSNLAKGVYNLQVNIGDENIHKRILIE